MHPLWQRCGNMNCWPRFVGAFIAECSIDWSRCNSGCVTKISNRSTFTSLVCLRVDKISRESCQKSIFSRGKGNVTVFDRLSSIIRSPFHRKKGAEFVETGRRCLPGITDLHTRDNGASHDGGGEGDCWRKRRGSRVPVFGLDPRFP